MFTFKDLILKDPDKIKLEDEKGIVHIFKVIEPTKEEIEQDSDTPVCSENLNKMQIIQRINITLDGTINANTNYTIPLKYKVRR